MEYLYVGVLIVLAGAIMGLALFRGAHQYRSLLFAAWISPLIPLAVATLVWIGTPYKRDDVAVFIWSFLACCIGFLTGLIGIFGMKKNGVFVTLLGAALGLLLNATVGFIALVMWGLSDLPQSP